MATTHRPDNDEGFTPNNDERFTQITTSHTPISNTTSHTPISNSSSSKKRKQTTPATTAVAVPTEAEAVVEEKSIDTIKNFFNLISPGSTVDPTVVTFLSQTLSNVAALTKELQTVKTELQHITKLHKDLLKRIREEKKRNQREEKKDIQEPRLSLTLTMSCMKQTCEV